MRAMQIMRGRLPIISLQGLTLEACVTHQPEWDVKEQVQRAIRRKRFLADYLTTVLTAKRHAPKIGKLMRLMDWVINNIRVVGEQLSLR
jgi:hypothetical protein